MDIVRVCFLIAAILLIISILIDLLASSLPNFLSAYRKFKIHRDYSYQQLINMQVVKIKQTDVLVLQTEKTLSREQLENLRGSLETHFPNNKVLVLADDVKLSVVSHKAEANHE